MQVASTSDQVLGFLKAIVTIVLVSGPNTTSAGSDASTEITETGPRTLGVEKFGNHTGPVRQVAVSPDGSMFATASYDDTAIVWDAKTQMPRYELKDHHDDVNSVIFSRDGQWIATGGDEGLLRIWDVATGQLVHQLPAPSPVTAEVNRHPGGSIGIAHSPNGDQFITFSDEDPIAYVWSIGEAQPVGSLVGHREGILDAIWSLDGGQVVTASRDGTAQVWNAQNGQLIVALPHDDTVASSAVYSPDGGMIITGAWDRKIRMWNASSYELVREFFAHSHDITSIAPSPDGATLAVAAETGDIWLWSMAGQPTSVLRGHTDWVRSIVWSQDGNRLVSGSDDDSIRLWDTSSFAPVGFFRGHEDWVRKIAISPDGSLLASASDDRTVRIWDLRQGSAAVQLLTGHEGEVSGLSFSPDGRSLISVAKDRELARAWDLESGLQTLTYHVSGTLFSEPSPDWIWDLDFSPDAADVVAAHKNGEVVLWSISERVKKWQRTWDSLPVLYGVSFSPDGNTIAVASADGGAYILDAHTGQILKTLKGHTNEVNAAVFSPDGRWLATASDDRKVLVWDRDGYTVGTTLVGHDDMVFDVEFSPDSTKLASASKEGEVILWELASSAEIARTTLRSGGNSVSIADVDFAPNGRDLLVAAGDGNAYLWQLEIDESIPVGQKNIPTVGQTEK